MKVPFKKEHLKNLDLDDSQLILGANTLDRYKSIDGPAITLLVDDKMIGCGGIERIWPGVGEAWLILSEYVFEYPITTVRVCRKHLPEMMKDFHRVQALVLEGFFKGMQFVHALGFGREGRMKHYGPNKENYVRYVILR